ncbi:Mss4-like protein [Gymnopilus junonius]|uniref:Mss4-like protein n=1 Tax=Gymnopilus junonius TaxID=109634 RepID=A0A9P5TIU8_GYMJU|nr:Mss4-like protein [Gymnopilus junonius]KAF8886041.1 Mss4-like protein [Gymnopilus junonius]
MPHTGTCLCGECTVHLESTHEEQALCHCWDCKQTSGSAFSTNVIAPMKGVKIEGPIKTYDIKAPSGNTVTRIFCGNCGSALSHKSVAFGDSQAIQTGNFRDFAKVPVTVELFVKDRWPVIPGVEGAQQCQAMT